MNKKRWERILPRLHYARAHIQAFSGWLKARGYADRTIRTLLGLLARFVEWSAGRGYGLDGLDRALAAAATDRGRRGLPGRDRLTVEVLGAGRLFARFLRETGVLPSLPRKLGPTDRWPRLAEFRQWMRDHRGVRDSSLDLWQRHLDALLTKCGDDPAAYTSASVRDFVLERAQTGGPSRARGVACAVRSYMRFLEAHGLCATDLQHAIPRFADWRLSSVPKYLPAADVDRIIEACAGPDRLRDRAIVLLLARLGLRASDVAGLRLNDIDWRQGRLAVSGKERRAQWLPLTQEIGDAILAYLQSRAESRHDTALFLTTLAPRQPITRITVKCIVKRAIARAGVRSPSQGAHVLRHSAATAMLRSGVSLDAIGAVLRHRSPVTTLLYAKVDLPVLARLARPWVGRLP